MIIIENFLKTTFFNITRKTEISKFLSTLFAVFFIEEKRDYEVVKRQLFTLIENEQITDNIAEIIKQLEEIRETLLYDCQFTYENDPACESYQEVLLAYQGFHAIFIYRVAHMFYLLNDHLLARMLSYHAYQFTGIDIHPAATIGRGFSIDHGNGIVIGSTARIGRNVKIFHGVTLGSLSTNGGQKLKGLKRHPTIEDNVTIYANATILGGDTIIKEGEVIKANAFIKS